MGALLVAVLLVVSGVPLARVMASPVPVAGDEGSLPAPGLSGILCEGRGLSVRGWKGCGGKDHIHGFEKD